MTAIGADDEIGTYFERAGRRVRGDADDAAGILDHPGRLDLHQQAEGRIAGAALRQEREEIPLRHERKELAARREAGEVRDRDSCVTEIRAECARFLMREPQELIQQAELMDDLERGGMDG